MLNKAILIGRLGQDPEMRSLPSGGDVCNFTMATSEKWLDKAGEKQEKTEWHRIVAFGKLAGVCHQYLKKGRTACVEGKIQTRQWDDKDGNKRSTTEIVAGNVVFLGGEDGRKENPGRGELQEQNDRDGQGTGNYPF